MTCTVFTNARIIDPVALTDQPGCLVVEDGQIVEVLEGTPETTDAEVHEWTTRFREGGALRGARKLAGQLLAQVDCEPALVNEVALHRLVTQTAQRLIAPLDTLTEGTQS